MKFNCENQKISDCQNKPQRKPKFITLTPNLNFLINVENVLNFLGLEKVEVQSNVFDIENISMDWNILWSFYHHEKYKLNWSSLKYHQKVNHWPGNRVLASKSILTTQTSSKFIPKGFLALESVQEYSKEHPEKKFVIKLKSNRGVKIVEPKDMKFMDPKSPQGYFAQEMITNPLLWNGLKFDIAVFVVITSVNPLRLYRYDNYLKLRFCRKPYNISNPNDVSSYVIGDDHIEAEHFKPIKKYLDENFTYKNAFDEFMRSKNANLSEIYNKIDELIRSVVMSNEKYLIEEINKIGGSKYNYFELFRFDMMIDEDFNLFLIEINLSPNLMATASDPHNQITYNNLLFNLFNLVGVGTTFEKNDLRFPSLDVEWIIAHPNKMSVKPEICLSDDCSECDDEKCSICWNCMNNNEKFELIQAYREQMNIGEFKRIFPPEKDFEFSANLSAKNKKHLEWFSEMCKRNKRFC